MIDEETVKSTASLASIELSAHEVGAYTTQLKRMLKYFGTLQEVDTRGVEPAYHALDLLGPTREDLPEVPTPRERILDNTTFLSEGFYRVPRVKRPAQTGEAAAARPSGTAPKPTAVAKLGRGRPAVAKSGRGPVTTPPRAGPRGGVAKASDQMMSFLDATHLAERCRSGALDPIEVVRKCLTRIRGVDSELSAFLALDETRCLAQAEALSRNGPPPEGRGRLYGVPVAVKDNISVKGFPLTCGSRILEGYKPVYDATVVRRILAEGAVVMGKTNLDEFSMGSSCEYSAYKTTGNPWNLNDSPGGSSGGSAAAVAGGLVPIALGSDTGGSIRQPASFCGCVGFKPTYGTVSRFGLVAFASSLDQVGPLTLTVRDAALAYEIMAGTDPRDSTMLAGPNPSVLEGLDQGIAGLRVGVPEEYLSKEVRFEIREAVENCLEDLVNGGAHIKRITLPHTRYALPTYYLVANAEASSNLARYDGMRYGARAEGENLLGAVYRATRKGGLGPEVKRRVMLGTFALREGYYDAYYLKALKVRRRIQEEFLQAFQEVDLIMGPTAPHPAFPLKEKIHDPLSLYQCDLLTVPASLAGIPGVSIPCGLTEVGFPVGLQILGPPLTDALVLRAAKAVEKWQDEILRSPLARKAVGEA